jgi:uncharacterized protein (TIGR02421 family)
MTPLTAADLAIDRELASISESFRFLVDLTPVNVSAARKEFLAASGDASPYFVYRDLEEFPEVIKARLDAIDLGGVADAALARLFEAKHRELRLQLAMLSARGSSDFLDLSLELYGPVGDALEQQAREILAETPKLTRSRGRCLDATGIARVAAAEIEGYRKQNPDLSVSIEVREDTSGVMVANGVLLIAATASVGRSRLAGLLAHEVGTHILTYFNGSLQPLKLMAAGLAGYEETQEGLALLAEAAVGGLTWGRLRQIAARVVAVKRLLDGYNFAEVHRELTDVYGFSKGGAFTIVMRVWRSGGLTKDAIYLRGLQELVEYIASKRDLPFLWKGKMSLTDLPLAEDLSHRGILDRPAIIPAFLEADDARQRLEAVATNAGLHQLIGAHT